MKAGMLRKIAKSFAPLFPSEWRLIGSQFIRYEGDWAQFVGFNASRWDDRFVPRTGCEFLKRPGVATATWLGTELLDNRSGTSYWVAATRDPGGLFQKMCEQFFPPIQKPLVESEIKARIAKDLVSHSYAYALCVISAEEGNVSGAKKYLKAYSNAVSDSPYPWADQQRAELTACVELMQTPKKLKTHLDSIRTEKLKSLKLN